LAAWTIRLLLVPKRPFVLVVAVLLFFELFEPPKEVETKASHEIEVRMSSRFNLMRGLRLHLCDLFRHCLAPSLSAAYFL
tara:strand:- start:215 stop:454 length:240 start_codon:yes stop_codon:yes gene_type:complete